MNNISLPVIFYLNIEFKVYKTKTKASLGNNDYRPHNFLTEHGIKWMIVFTLPAGAVEYADFTFTEE